MTDQQIQRDTYRLADLATAAVTDKPSEPVSAYEDLLKVAQALQEASVPTENRVMYYYVWSWWHHPMKRWKQERLLRKLARMS